MRLGRNPKEHFKEAQRTPDGPNQVHPQVYQRPGPCHRVHFRVGVAQGICHKYVPGSGASKALYHITTKPIQSRARRRISGTLWPSTSARSRCASIGLPGTQAQRTAPSVGWRCCFSTKKSTPSSLNHQRYDGRLAPSADPRGRSRRPLWNGRPCSPSGFS